MVQWDGVAIAKSGMMMHVKVQDADGRGVKVRWMQNYRTVIRAKDCLEGSRESESHEKGFRDGVVGRTAGLSMGRIVGRLGALCLNPPQPEYT